MLDQPRVVPAPESVAVPVTPPVEAAASAPDETPERRPIWKMLLTIAALGAMSLLFVFFPIDWDQVGNWGYLGVFLVTFIATASFILPIPYLLIVARAGMYLNPLLVTLIAGVAGALGETTGYIVGASGRDLFPTGGKLFQKANHWMVTYGFWCVAFFAFVPNPIFDAIGFAAGVLRYPLWKFVLACFLGKSLKFLLAAESHLVIHWTCMVLPQVCDVWHTFSLGLLG